MMSGDDLLGLYVFVMVSVVVVAWLVELAGPRH